MPSPNFLRRKIFLGVQAALDSSTPVRQRKNRSVNVALAALVFSLPVMAGVNVEIDNATESLTNAAAFCSGDEGFKDSGCNVQGGDPLYSKPPRPPGTDNRTIAFIVLLDRGTPSATGNNLILNGWTSSSSYMDASEYSVTGGGSFAGGIVGGDILADGNKLELKNSSAIGGSAVGGAVWTTSNASAGTDEAKGSAQYNTVTIGSGSSTGKDVIGGLAQGMAADHEVKAEGNVVNFSGQAENGAVYGGWAGITGESGSATAERNTVTVDGSNATVMKAPRIVGGSVYNSDNFSGAATAKDNEVIIINVDTNVHLTADVYGGQVMDEGNTNAETLATGNKVYIGGKTSSPTTGASFTGNVYGGYIHDNGRATNNDVTIWNSRVVASDVIGGLVGGVYGSVIGNTVTIGTLGGTDNSEVIASLVAGGMISNPENAGAVGRSGQGNTVTLNSGMVKMNSGYGGNVFGGFSVGDGEISYNVVNINGGEVEGDAAGGKAGFTSDDDVADGDVTHNEVYLRNNGKVDSDVSGGWSQTGNAEWNKVFIYGGTIESSNGPPATVTGGYVEENDAIKHDDKNGQATNNIVTIDNTGADGAAAILIVGTVASGIVNPNSRGNAESNTVIIKKGSLDLEIKDSVTGGATYGGGSVMGNGVTISGGTTVVGQVYQIIGISGGVVGGLAAGTSGSVTGNTVTIGENVNDTTQITGMVVGGAILNPGNSSGTVGGHEAGNTVTLKGGTVSQHETGTGDEKGGDVIGGFNFGRGEVSYNRVEIEGSHVARDVIGGYAKGGGSATHNTITLGGTTTTVEGNVLGGWIANPIDDKQATDNTVTLDGSAQVTGNVYGGWQDGNGSSDIFTGNTLNKKSTDSGIAGTAGNFAKLIFGYNGSANIGTLDTTPNDGADSAATGVTLEVTTSGHNVNFNGNITGSGDLTKTGAGTLTLLSGKTYDYTGDTTVNAGMLDLSGTLSASNSTVTVNNDATLTLRGKANGDVTLNSGATLNAIQGGRVGGNLDATGANLYFYLPTGFSADATVLNVEGQANVTDSRVDIGVVGPSSPLKEGDSVTLIDAAGNLAGDAPENDMASGNLVAGKLDVGALLSYDFELITESNRLLAKVLRGEGGGGGGGEGGGGGGGGPVPPNIKVGSKAISEGFLAGSAFLNQGTDFLVNRGLAAAQRAGAQSARNGEGLTGFVAIGGGRLKHDTGSHIDVDGYTVIAGLAATRNLPVGEVTFGAFIEHGEGDYDTSNSFANAASVHGKGDADYTGGGLLARLKLAETARGHLYTEASARAGKVSLDFTARELRDISGRIAAYDSDSRYASAHAGLGYVLKLNERSSLDLYGQYLWSHQGSDKVTLTTAEEVKFKAVDSQRTRLGTRWSQSVGQNGKAYLGAAWEHEYDGQAKASIHGARIATPDLKGDTGLVEAGFTLAPGATRALTLDVGLQGYTGQREGVTGSFKVNYRF